MRTRLGHTNPVSAGRVVRAAARRAGRGGLLVSLALAGCFPSGPEFEGEGRIRGVRVLAAVPEPASGTPGGRVQLRLEAFDSLQHPTVRAARAGVFGPDAGAVGNIEPPPAPLAVLWLGPCHNPPGDAHFGCYPALTAIAEALPDPVPLAAEALPSGAPIGFGPTFSVSIPGDILDGRATDPRAPVYGVSFAFFAVCRGTLRPDPGAGDGVPLRCEGPDGLPVGSEGFVRGFTRLYTFDAEVNRNPSLTAIRFAGQDVPVQSCEADADCAGRVPGLRQVCRSPVLANAADLGAPARRCVPAVTRCQRPPCPTYELLPRLDPNSIDRDGLAALPGAPPPPEIVWVKYYGLIPVANREALIQDRASGFHPDYAAGFVPPGIEFDPPLPVWAVMQDNRGGVAVARWDIVVTE